jgi:superfamily II DNA/RNA helicase
MIFDKLYNLESFQRQYESILKISVGDTIPNLIWDINRENLLKEINWNNVLSIGSVLCQSSNSIHLDTSLRIAQACLTCKTTETQKSGAAVILETLTNQISIKLAIERNLLSDDYASNLPLPFKILNNQTRVRNSITINDSIVSLNRFQKEVYDASRANSAISISAPTSAGKSFILYQLLIEELKNPNKNIVYVVPTRALISQVEEDLTKLMMLNGISNINLTTVPLQNESSNQSNLFVFTQERLHWYLIQSTDKRIDFLLIDEAHKIDNNNRGILLQRKIEDVIDLNPDVKVYFSSPFTSNPEVLFENLSLKKNNKAINTEFVAVNQNLLYVTQVKSKPTKWHINLITKQKSIEVGIVELSDRPTPESRKLALISKAVSGSKYGNLIYANGAAESEKYANIVYELSEDDKPCEELKELIKLVKNTIHKDYILGKVLNRKIAFHYGNMPLLIRQEIERLFKLNKIKYLICTSTLLEGVNLPATAVFIRKPTRGKNKPLNENDFWNLAGRAGRWGKEFSGNIVCIQPKEWGFPPSPNKRKQKIVKALDELEVNRGDDFIRYIQDGSPRSEAERNQEYEFAFSYYYSRFLENKLGQSQFHLKLKNLFEELKPTIEIPDAIILKNPGISPIAQQELLSFFEDRKMEIESLIPVYPEDENAYDEYVKFIGRIGKTLASFFPQLNPTRAIVLIYWMSGKPLSYIINSSINNYKSKGASYKVDSVCRSIMEMVENFARFRFAKESSCYIDILRFYLKEINRNDLLEDIPDLNLWLEFGVSQESQLSLLSFGLSRNSVVTISEYTPSTQMSKAECKKWLLETNFEQLNLSEIIIMDIEKTRNKILQVTINDA